MNNPKAELSLSEVAARWKCSLSNIMHHHLGPGKLQPTKRGRSQMVRVADLVAYEAKLAPRAEARARRARAQAQALRFAAR